MIKKRMMIDIKSNNSEDDLYEIMIYLDDGTSSEVRVNLDFSIDENISFTKMEAPCFILLNEYIFML